MPGDGGCSASDFLGKNHSVLIQSSRKGSSLLKNHHSSLPPDYRE
jgi:hypothetical protein